LASVLSIFPCSAYSAGSFSALVKFVANSCTLMPDPEPSVSSIEDPILLLLAAVDDAVAVESTPVVVTIQKPT
jgi:hypothetical protein